MAPIPAPIASIVHNTYRWSGRCRCLQAEGRGQGPRGFDSPVPAPGAGCEPIPPLPPPPRHWRCCIRGPAAGGRAGRRVLHSTRPLSPPGTSAPLSPATAARSAFDAANRSSHPLMRLAQRFRSRPVPCATEPEFDESFLLELQPPTDTAPISPAAIVQWETPISVALTRVVPKAAEATQGAGANAPSPQHTAAAPPTHVSSQARGQQCSAAASAPACTTSPSCRQRSSSGGPRSPRALRALASMPTARQRRSRPAPSRTAPVHPCASSCPPLAVTRAAFLPSVSWCGRPPVQRPHPTSHTRTHSCTLSLLSGRGAGVAARPCQGK